MNDLTPFEQFLSVERHLSTVSIQAYLQDVTHFLRFKTAQPNATVLDYFMQSDVQSYKPSTLHRKRSALRLFFVYLGLDDNPMDGFHIKREHRLPNWLTQDEVASILVSPSPEDRFYNRDVAILELFYAAGLRVSELASLMRTDYRPSEGVIKVLGKGKRQRYVPLYPRVIEKIQRYLESRDVLNEPLFVNRFNQALSRQSLYNLVVRYAKRAGLKKVHPHMFRHSCASHCLEGGMDLYMVQTLLGHKKITTTEHYTHLANATLRDRFMRSHPR